MSRVKASWISKYSLPVASVVEEKKWMARHVNARGDLLGISGSLVYSLNCWAKERIGNLKSVSKWSGDEKKACINVKEREPLSATLVYESDGVVDTSDWFSSLLDEFEACLDAEGIEKEETSNHVNEIEEAFLDRYGELLQEVEGAISRRAPDSSRYIISEDSPYFLVKRKREGSYKTVFPDNPNEKVVEALFSLSQAFDAAFIDSDTPSQEFVVKADFEAYHCPSHRGEFFLKPGACPFEYYNNTVCCNELEPIGMAAFVFYRGVEGMDFRNYLLFYGEEREEGVSTKELVEKGSILVRLPVISVKPYLEKVKKNWKDFGFSTTRDLTVMSER